MQHFLLMNLLEKLKISFTFSICYFKQNKSIPNHVLKLSDEFEKKIPTITLSS